MNKSQQKTMYAEFVSTFNFCWACRLQPLPLIEMEWPFWLENAHIVGGSGRIAKREMICRLCKIHHDLNEGHTYRYRGNPLPRLTFENMLWLKRRYDPEFYDEFVIAKHRKDKNGILYLPEPMPPEPILNNQIPF